MLGASSDRLAAAAAMHVPPRSPLRIYDVYMLCSMTRSNCSSAVRFLPIDRSPAMAGRRPFPAPTMCTVLLAFSWLAASSFVSDAGSGRHGRRGHVARMVTEEVYASSLFPHKDDAACPARNFYSYSAFVRAAESFPRFGGAGDRVTRKREVAAFLAQISHETTGGWPTAPDGPYAWGLCFKEELKPASNYCDATATEWPCHPGKSYHGRGPIQLSWNFNYGPAGKALGFDGLASPEVVAGDAEVAFKTALWFWMTRRPPKPSCHDVMVGKYRPSAADKAANRTAGFGLTTNIINGGLECNRTDDPRVMDRIGYFRRYCGILGVDVGDNLDCANQLPYS